MMPSMFPTWMHCRTTIAWCLFLHSPPPSFSLGVFASLGLSLQIVAISIRKCLAANSCILCCCYNNRAKKNSPVIKHKLGEIVCSRLTMTVNINSSNSDPVRVLSATRAESRTAIAAKCHQETFTYRYNCRTTHASEEYRVQD